MIIFHYTVCFTIIHLLMAFIYRCFSVLEGNLSLTKVKPSLLSDTPLADVLLSPLQFVGSKKDSKLGLSID